MLPRKGNRIYLDNCWYMIKDDNRGFLVYDDGEYEGRYVGSLETLDSMPQDKALDLVLSGL